MGVLFQQILDLMADPYGSMAYHLMITFTVIGVLPGAVNSYQTKVSAPNRRKLLGIGMLLLIR